MKRKKVKKFTNTPKMIAPETQNYLDQLDIIDKQFIFYADECDKLEKEFRQIEENDRYSPEAEKRQNEIAQKFQEIEARYERDKITFEGLIKKIGIYFQNRYGITIDFKM